MKSKLWLLAAILMLGLSTAALAQEEKGDDTAAPMNMEDMQMKMDAGTADNAVMNKEEGQAVTTTTTTTTTTGAVEVGNKICPVSGKEIVMENKGTVEYNGKIYNLCCSMCKKDFLKEPEKYIEKLKAMEASGEAATEEKAAPQPEQPAAAPATAPAVPETK